MNFTLPAAEVSITKKFILDAFNKERGAKLTEDDVQLYIVRGNYQAKFAVGLVSISNSFHCVFYVKGFKTFPQINPFKLEHCEVARAAPDSEVWVSSGFLSSKDLPIFAKESNGKNLHDALNQERAALLYDEETFLVAQDGGRILI